MARISIPLDVLTSRLNLAERFNNVRSQSLAGRFSNLKPVSEFLDVKRLSRPGVVTPPLVFEWSIVTSIVCAPAVGPPESLTRSGMLCCSAQPLTAVALYCAAARAGNAEAQYNIGWMFANGRGVERDEAIASSFFALAAKGGHEYAQKMLARLGPSNGELPECMKHSSTG